MINFPHIRNITVTGRIASGATTLAKQLADILQWHFIEGSGYSDVFFKEIGINEVNVHLRPDHLDRKYDEKVKELLKTQEHYIIQSHLAGFDAQGIDGVFKILTLCNDKNGNDKPEVRIDRLVNRKNISVKDAKKEINDREKENLQKWRRMYANNDPSWVYWDPVYYDLVINTYMLNKQESLEFVLKQIGYHS